MLVLNFKAMGHIPGAQDFSDLDNLGSSTCEALLKGGECQNTGELEREAGAEMQI